MSTQRPKSLGPLLLLVGSLGTILAIAVALGIVFTIGPGGGLMALVFYSARHGYDDAAASGDEHDERRPGRGS